MSEIISFGVWIKRQRKILDLTQAELAQRVGCATTTIQKFEADERRPSKETAARLAQALELVPEMRAPFIKAARAELNLDHLDPAPHTYRTRHTAPPPWHPAGHLPGSLPTPLTLLIGREREVAAVCKALQDTAVRLLTLTGPGGIGKTRLALQVGTNLQAAFADGAIFVDLAPLVDPALVVTSIAQRLGVHGVGGQSLLGAMMHYLRDKHLLLLLDNFEQVAAAAPMVAELLTAAPQLKVLITSRVVLGVYGEHLVEVPPLSYATPEHMLSGARGMQQLLTYPAIRLFIERARAMQAGFALTEDNATAVAAICQRLDGLPLGIELAAARIRLLSPRQLLGRLEQCLPLLTGGSSTLPARQRTLRATIDWSYNLLDAREQVLFRSLSVFVGGWSLEAAAAVCAVNSRERDVVEGLQGLLDKHLVRNVQEVSGEPRYTILETIREYALEQLVASGELERLQRQHAEYFVTLAETAQTAMVAQLKERWWQRLDVEHANFQAVLAWSRAEGAHELALRLAVALGHFWARCGRLSEGRAWLTSALAGWQVSEASGSFTTAYRALRAKALNLLGLIAHWQGDLDAAQPWHEESLRLFQELGDRAGIVDQINMLGMLAESRGDHRRAQAYFNESLALARELGDAILVSWCRFFQGTLAYTEGDTEWAGALWDESLSGFRAEEQLWGIANVLANLAMVALDQGEYRKASAQLVESLTLLRDLGERWQIVHTLEVCARLAAEQQLAWKDGQAGVLRAAQLFGAAETLRKELGAPVLSFQRQSYERGIATLRAHLDDATRAAAWAEGQAMTLEQAIADALALTQLPAEPTSIRLAERRSDRASIVPTSSSTAQLASLTPRECEVLRWVAQGLSTAEVATHLHLSPLTVNVHLRAIYRKLHVTSRTAATRIALDHHLV
ncbi:MAG TPA: LuxR C-terminal-related transcriptional regulator [Roseiflexaceae bacterium]|nr:LuxR C-terminal-related transcriptional regulator [Roseiflexaceae bacterium]